MIELLTLGGLSCRHVDESRLGDLLRHPKPLALLIYLAVEGRNRSLTRDDLIGIFWPEATEYHARQSLNQAVARLRRCLGRNAVVRNEYLPFRIASEAIAVDAGAFDMAMAAENWAKALETYRGDFLSGFLIADTPRFEDWASLTREKYRRKAVQAAEARAAQLRRGGEVMAAARALAWAAETAPEREDLAAAAIEGLAGCGDPLGAIDWFIHYSRCLKERLDLAPSLSLESRVRELREGVHRGAAVPLDPIVTAEGARSPAPSSTILDNDPEDPSISAVSDAAPLIDARSHWLARASVVALALVVSIYFGGRLTRSATAVPGDRFLRTTVALTVVDRTPGSGSPYLAAAIGDALAARLSHPPRLYVAVRKDAGARQQPHADFEAIGAVYQNGERIRVDLMLAEPVSGRHIRMISTSRSAEDVLELLDETAEELAAALRSTIGSAVATRQAQRRTKSAAAWVDLERSKALLAEATRFAQTGSFKQAADLLSLADSLANSASQADPAWPDSYLQLAQILRQRGTSALASANPDLDSIARLLERAAAILDTAVSRWADDPAVLSLAGTVAFERWLTGRSSTREDHHLDLAQQFLSRAISIDPYASSPWITLSAVYAARLDYGASAVAAEVALRRDVFEERIDELHNRLFHANFELGRDEAAAHWCDEINRREPRRVLGAFCDATLRGWTAVRPPDVSAVDSMIDNLDADPPAFIALMRPRLRMLQASVAVRQGDFQKARRLLDEAVAAAAVAGDSGAAIFNAAALVRLGDFDQALQLLHRSAHERDARLPVARWFRELNRPRTAEPGAFVSALDTASAGRSASKRQRTDTANRSSTTFR